MNKDIINSDVLHLIIPFLELPEIARCQLVSRQWNAVVQSASIWQAISDSSEKRIRSSQLFHPWLISKVRKHKPKKLLLYDRDNLWPVKDLLELFGENNENMRKLKLFLELDEGHALQLITKIVENCPKLKSFQTHGRFVSDANMVVFQGLAGLTEFGVYNDDVGFTGANLRKLLPLSKLFLRPHNVEYDALKPIIEKSKSELKKLCIDCEILEQKELLDLLSLLNTQRLETIMLNYCEKFDEEVLKALLRFSSLRKLRFTKGSSVPSEAFLGFTKNLDCGRLVSLNLAECSEIRDASLFQIAGKAHNLRKLKLSWCTELTSCSIREVFLKCLYLKKVFLTGVKLLNAKAFPFIDRLLDFFKLEEFRKKRKERKLDLKLPGEVFKPGWDVEQIDCYRFLRLVDVRSCDLVNDELLIILKLLFPGMRLINYYGEELAFD